MGKSCVLVPKVIRADGTEVESKLYNDLKKHPALKGNRPLMRSTSPMERLPQMQQE